MAATLAEPVVLAAAKEALYPDLGASPTQYAVADTQFTRMTWGEWSVPESVHDRLRPFNSIRLHSGEPDLIAVGAPEAEVLDAGAAENPVIAVEAKGDASAPEAADVTRGIEQAHARLSEVNLGYVATPIQSVTETARSLARDLNVGVLGVHADETVEFIEPARVTGAGEFSTGIEAVRFQASAHRLTEGSFPVNHPKNFLGYVLALAAEEDTSEVYAEHVIQLVSAGRHGAILLGLIDDRSDGDYLTHLGAEVVRFAREEYGSLSNALQQFDAWDRRSTRFTELAPKWAMLARAVTMQYEPTKLVVDSLEQLHRGGVQEPTLSDLVSQACELNQPLAVEVFISRGSREDVLEEDGELDESALDDSRVYKSGAHFQFKAQLYHVGLITSGGTDDGVEAVNDVWRLEQPIGRMTDWR